MNILLFYQAKKFLKVFQFYKLIVQQCKIAFGMDNPYKLTDI